MSLESYKISPSIKQICSLIAARVPYIWVLTHEEKRFSRELAVTLSEGKIFPPPKPVFHEYSICSGFQLFNPAEFKLYSTLEAKQLKVDKGEESTPHKPRDAIKDLLTIAQRKVLGDSQKDRKEVFLLKDFHLSMDQPVPRILRDSYEQLIHSGKTIIIVAPTLGHGHRGSKPGIDPTLEKQFTVVEYELPNYECIHSTVDLFAEGLSTQMKEKGKEISYSKEERSQFTRALQGLTSVEVDNALSACVRSKQALDLRHLLDQKKQIIKRSDILEYVETPLNFDHVGGLDQAKAFFSLYNNQFHSKAKDFGVEPLKGILLTGLPGCGKSLTAKAVASVWGLPLLRLDVGKVMTGIVGGSEQRMRQVISQAEAVAPTVLWIDEIEKGLSGTGSSNMSDGGTLSRVFGTLLTAMEERMQGVVLFATANDVSALPPELIRRFDEVFFVNFPRADERRDIFEIHLKKRNRDPKDIDINLLIENTENFTGAEIEKAVKLGIMKAFQEDQRKLITEDILTAVQDTKPLHLVMKEQINRISDWAKGRARYASKQEEDSIPVSEPISHQDQIKKRLSDSSMKDSLLEDE